MSRKDLNKPLDPMDNPADLAEAKRVETLAASGEDPFGDFDDDDGTPLPGGEPVIQAAAEEPEAEPQAAEEAVEAAPEADAKPEDAPEDDKPAVVEPDSDVAPVEATPPDRATFPLEEGLPRAEPIDTAPIETRRKALATERAEARKKMLDGEMDADAYAAIEDRVESEREELLVQLVQAKTSQANEQREYTAACVRLAERVKNELDYSKDPKAVKTFDAVYGAMVADPDNARRPFAAIAKEAHAAVLAMRGVKAAVQAPAPKPAAPVVAAKPTPPARKPEAGPVTLRGVPNASQSNTGPGMDEQLSRLHGQDFEAWFAKATPSQRAALLDD